MSLEKKIPRKSGKRITVDLTAPAREEFERLERITGYTTAQLFQYALTQTRYLIEHY